MSFQSKYRLFKLFLNLILIAILGLVIFQNSEPVKIDFLVWEKEMPLAMLLFFVAVLGAVISFIITLWTGRN